MVSVGVVDVSAALAFLASDLARLRFADGVVVGKLYFVVMRWSWVLALYSCSFVFFVFCVGCLSGGGIGIEDDVRCGASWICGFVGSGWILLCLGTLREAGLTAPGMPGRLGARACSRWARTGLACGGGCSVQ